MIAEPVQWGHTVWCADLDGDGDDELIVGQRDPNPKDTAPPRGPGVFVFDLDRGAGALVFDRHTIDDGGVACEDALAVDLNGDGRLDIVAGGRATHNVKIYWNQGASSTAAQIKTDPKINEPFMNPDLKAFITRFESNDREPYAKRNEIVEALGLRPGMSVADVGAGTGFFTRLFAEKVGATGRVYAIDIAPQFLAHIAAESKKRGQTNVVTVRGDQDGIKLPPQSVDLVFLSDVYHHLEKPEKALSSIHRALRPGGTLVVIEFDKVEGKSTPFVLKHVRATKNVFRKEIETAGFQEFAPARPPVLKENFFLRFRKTGARTGAAAKD